MRILMIADYLPYPAVMGTQVRTYNVLRRMAAKHDVWLACLGQSPDDTDAVKHLKGFCQGVETDRAAARPALAHVPGLLRFAVAGKPLELKFYYSARLASQVRSWAGQVGFDVVHIENSHMAQYLDALPPGQGFRSLTFIDIVYVKYQRLAQQELGLFKRLRQSLYADTMKRWEPQYAGRFDVCFTMSEVDRRMLLAANPRLRLEVSPNGVDTRSIQSLPEDPVATPAVLFVGNMAYAPSVDAVRFFCRDVLPKVRITAGPVEFWIVGPNPSAEVRALEGDGVHVTGRVADVTPFYRRATVAVAPIRAGGGTRIKVLEAMAFGRPVVSTSIGSEGLEAQGGVHLLAADDAESFARQTSALLLDKGQRQRVARSARRLVEEKYDWDPIVERMLRTYEESTCRSGAEG